MVQILNRKAYSEAKHGDIRRERYARMDQREVKPTVHTGKKSMGAEEAAAHGISNRAIVEWLICNEAAGAKAAACTDHLGILTRC